MALNPPPEKIAILRHRVARTNEIWKAYQIFWDRQIPIGEGLTCHSEENASNITYLLLVVYLSYIYSVFDDSACHFIDDTGAILEDLTPTAIEAREHIIQLWKVLENPVQRLRHNTGFHGGKNMKSLLDGYKQLNQRHINVAMADCLMLFMDAFFRELDNIYDFEEGYLINKHPDYPKELFELALGLEESILLRGFGQELNPIFNEHQQAKTMSDPLAALLTTTEGVFLGRLIGPAAENMGEVVAARLQQLTSQVHQHFVNAGREPQTVEMKVVVPLLNSAALETEPDLIAMWAALLATAADPAAKVDVTVGYVDILRQLAPPEVKIIEYLYAKYLDDQIRFEIILDPLFKQLGMTSEVFDIAISNLLRLQLCELPPDDFNINDDGDLVRRIAQKEEMGLTALGKSFLAACSPPAAAPAQP